MINKIKNELEERTGRTFRVHEVKKNNGVTLTGLTVEDLNVAPTVYVNDIVRDIEAGDVTLEEAVDKMANLVENAIANAPDVSREKLLKWPAVIIPKLVNKEANKELLETLVYEDVPGTDIAMYYNIFVDNFGDGLGTIKIGKKEFEELGCSLEELKEAADAYVVENMEVASMETVIAGLLGVSLDELHDMGMDAPTMPMYVVTNKAKVNGAACVLKAYDKLKEALGEDIIILPSSTHEVIAIPYSEDFSLFRGIVEEINFTEVSAEEKLSDNVYRLTEDGLQLLTVSKTAQIAA